MSWGPKSIPRTEHRALSLGHQSRKDAPEPRWQAAELKEAPRRGWEESIHGVHLPPDAGPLLYPYTDPERCYSAPNPSVEMHRLLTNLKAWPRITAELK